ncbi:MAG: ABC transporter permease [Propionibacteriaceae bacterium]|nr:ABC transporter permease [Propionibacteriaceae bacterium]
MGKDTAAKANRRVYTPHKAGIPNLRQYFTELWHRLDFAKEMSDTNIRAGNTNTFLGQAWLVLNPLLLAAVYYLLVMIIGGGARVDPVTGVARADFPQIAGGLFLFFLVSGIVQACATSVTNAGSLILNMNFPKQLLIFANTYLALRRFIPTMVVYAVIHIVFGRPISWTLLWLPLAVVFAALIGMGLGSIVATWHVYFRDTANFLPYVIRIWLYASPVLYTGEQFLTGIGKSIGEWILFNPVFGMLGMWSDALHGQNPPWHYVVVAAAWAIVLSIGGVLYFISRERDFAVRL